MTEQFFETYHMILLASWVIMFVLGAVTLGVSGPFGVDEYSYYRRSRFFLGLVYELTGICLFLDWGMNLRLTKADAITNVALANAYFTALMIGAVYTPLIDHSYFSTKRFRTILAKLLLFLSAITIRYYSENPGIRLGILIVCMIEMYYEYGQTIYDFHRKYLIVNERIINESADNYKKYITWTLSSYIMFIFVGIIEGVGCFGDIYINSLILILLDLAMIYTYIVFYNYGINLPINMKNTKQKGESVSYARVKELAKQWIEDKGWTENGLTTDILAIRFGSNRKYITKFFSEEKGETFRAYINKMRIEEGKRMLEETDLPIEEISSTIGYSSRNQFATIFNTQVGCSPREYRQNIRSNQRM